MWVDILVVGRGGLVISQDQLTIAKCGDTIVGIDVASSASETEIRILEAADAGDNSCFVRVGLGSFDVCPSAPTRRRDLRGWQQPSLW